MTYRLRGGRGNCELQPKGWAFRSATAPVSRSGARLDLARFYFAHGYGPEALGVIEAIQHDDPSFAAEPRVRAVTGGAVTVLRGVLGENTCGVEALPWSMAVLCTG